MKITLRERLELLLNYPSKGTPLKLMILDEIKTLINISSEEREEYEICELLNNKKYDALEIMATKTFTPIDHHGK